MPSPGTKSIQAQKAAAVRWGKPAADLAREYAAASIADYIQRVVATAPPLTEDQRTRLAGLLGVVA